MKVVEWASGETVGGAPVGDQTVYLKLVPSGNEVDLVECDEKGRPIAGRSILRITKEGKVKLHGGIDRDTKLSIVEPKRYIEVVCPVSA